MFRGREQAHPERGRMLLDRLYEDVAELAVIEQHPLQEGRNMSMLLAPSREVARQAQSQSDSQPAPAAAESAATTDSPGEAATA
jgi:translation initiation factor IF-3